MNFQNGRMFTLRIMVSICAGIEPLSVGGGKEYGGGIEESV